MIKFCACGWRINIWNFILDSSASAIWYFCYVSAIILVFCLLFSFCNLVFELSFSKKNKIGVIFCLLLLQNLVFRLLFNFCFRFCKIWYFDCPSASTIWYFCLSLQLFWYFVFSSVSVIWYLCSVSAIVLVFRLLFSFCKKKNLERYFIFRFCKI